MGGRDTKKETVLEISEASDRGEVGKKEDLGRGIRRRRQRLIYK
jgi:hypothetical protein